ncbi:MAG: transposase, partial [Thioclava sp.]
KVVRPVFRKPDPEPTEKPQPDVDEAQAAIVADLASRRPVKEPEESARERFKRALDLERKQQEGGEITKDQQRWLSSYQNTPEYAAERLLWEDFGDAMFR